MTDKIKIRVEMFRAIADYSDTEIADIVRSIIAFHDDGILPDEGDKLYQEKMKFVTAVKRSASAIEKVARKRSQEEMNALSNKNAEEFKKRFAQWYFNTFNLPYNFTKSDSNAVAGLLNNVAEQMRAKNIAVDDENIVKNTMIFVAKVYEISDDWLKERFRIGLLNSMFSTYYYRIKNHEQKNGKPNSNISEDYIYKTITEYVAGDNPNG